MPNKLEVKDFPKELIKVLHFYLGLQSRCPLAAACVPKLRKVLPNSHTTETLTCLSYAKILRRSVAFQLAQTELVKKWRTHRIFMCGEKSSFRSTNVSLTLVFFGAICSNLRPPLAPRKFPIFFQKFVFRDDVKRQKKPPNSDCLKQKFCVCSTLKLHSGLLDKYIILHKEEDRHLKFHTIRYRTKSYT